MLRAALGLSLGGHATSLAAAAVDDAANVGLTDIIQGGGSAAAVAGLVYIARMIAKGELVPRPVRDTEIELSHAVRAAGEREARLMLVLEDHREIVIQQRAQQVSMMNLTNDVVRTATLCQETVRQANELLQWWKERRGQNPG